MTPTFASRNGFFATSGHASSVWLAVVMTIILLMVLAVYSVIQHRTTPRGVAQQRVRKACLRAAQQQEAV